MTLPVSKGPIHTFNGHRANFYISTGQGLCSIDNKQNAFIDAQYFCSHFYGPNFKASSYQQGRYLNSGIMGYQMHKGVGCHTLGEDIEGTNCSGGKCKIWSTSIDHGGLYNIICLG